MIFFQTSDKIRPERRLGRSNEATDEKEERLSSQEEHILMDPLYLDGGFVQVSLPWLLAYTKLLCGDRRI